MIKASTLVINGDRDVVLPAHALELASKMKKASVYIVPGGHGEYLGEIEFPSADSSKVALTASMINLFLKN